MSIETAISSTLSAIFSFAAARRGGWTAVDALMKGDEELGELSEAIQVTLGRVTHKQLKENPLGEVADNLNQLLDLCSVTSYRLTSFSFLTDRVRFELAQKRLSEHALQLDHTVIAYYMRFRLARNGLFPSAAMSEDSVYAMIVDLIYLAIFLHLAHEKIDASTFNETHYQAALSVLADCLGKKFEKWAAIENKTN